MEVFNQHKSRKSATEFAEAFIDVEVSNYEAGPSNIILIQPPIQSSPGDAQLFCGF
jgi:hypothetical protein